MYLLKEGVSKEKGVGTGVLRPGFTGEEGREASPGLFHPFLAPFTIPASFLSGLSFSPLRLTCPVSSESASTWSYDVRKTVSEVPVLIAEKLRPSKTLSLKLRDKMKEGQGGGWRLGI